MKAYVGLQLYEHICDEQECTDIGCSNPEVPATVLLKPEEYEIVDEARLPELVKLLSVGQLKGSPVGGLTFGVHVPEVKNRGQRVSYPSGPTWQVSTLLPHRGTGGRALLSQLTIVPQRYSTLTVTLPKSRWHCILLRVRLGEPS